MFTGIIEELGTVEALESRAAGGRLRIACCTVTGDMRTGSSISVNGVCLTALDLRPDGFSADLAPETLKRSNLGALHAGSRVNLERPLSPSSRFDGHIVQGHVDGTGEFLSLDSLGADNWWLRVRIPADLDRYLVSKGSIAIDGISLTVARWHDRIAEIAIIPFTYEQTNVRDIKIGDAVNLEGDVLGKYVERYLEARSGAKPASNLTIEQLVQQGF